MIPASCRSRTASRSIHIRSGAPDLSVRNLDYAITISLKTPASIPLDDGVTCVRARTG